MQVIMGYLVTAVLVFVVVNQVWVFVASKASDPAFCRDSWIHNMSCDDFLVYSCSKCFVQVFMNEKDLKIQFPPTYPYLLYSNMSDPNATVFSPDAEEDDSLVCAHSLNHAECKMWKNCCQAAKHCCSVTQQNLEAGPNTLFCPATWDGVSCWKSTPGGHQQKQTCPSYYVMAHVMWTQPQAQRFCELGGTWRTNNYTLQEYSDYGECFDVAPNLHILRVSLFIDFIGNGTSILFLVTAIGLIVGFRELRVELHQRTGLKVHFSLFVSVLLTSIFNIAFHSVYYDAFTNQHPVYEDNAVWCRALHIMMKYFKSTTCMCMFCEGLFLYRRISQVMQIGVNDYIIKYVLIGWGSPIVTISTYVVVMVSTGHNEKCWMDDTGPSNYEFIHMIPNLCSLVCNLVFLISIQYMLCTKMRSDTSDRRIEVLRHAIRATMSLIPIFGLQFLFLIYRPKNWPPYEIIVAIFESTLGAMVATLYCFTTREVRSVIRNRLHTRQQRRRQTIDQPIRMSHASHAGSKLENFCCKMQCFSPTQPRSRQRMHSSADGTCNTYLEVPNPRRDSSISKSTQKSFCDGSGSSINSQLRIDMNMVQFPASNPHTNGQVHTMDVAYRKDDRRYRCASSPPLPVVSIQKADLPQADRLLDTSFETSFTSVGATEEYMMDNITAPILFPIAEATSADSS